MNDRRTFLSSLLALCGLPWLPWKRSTIESRRDFLAKCREAQDRQREELLREHPHLQMVEGKTFRDQKIEGKGKMFYRCEFWDCTLCDPPIVHSCIFNSSSGFAGPCCCFESGASFG